MTTRFDILGIGNAIVDVVAQRRRHVPVAPRHAQGLDDADRRRCGRCPVCRDAAGPGEQRRIGGEHLRGRCGAGRARRLSRQGGERPAGHRVPPRHDRDRRALPLDAAVRRRVHRALPDRGDAGRAAHDAHLSRRLRQLRRGGRHRCTRCRCRGDLPRGLSVRPAGGAARVPPCRGRGARGRAAGRVVVVRRVLRRPPPRGVPASW